MKKILALTFVFTIGYFFLSKQEGFKKVSLTKFKTSIKASKTNIITKKKIIPNEDIAVKTNKIVDNKVEIVNKYKEIKNEYFTEHSKKLKLSVSKIKDSKIIINGKSTRVTHVLVKATKRGGPTSSYEALVNPKTKQVYRTWNQTKFETNRDFKVKSAGLEFYSN